MYKKVLIKHWNKLLKKDPALRGFLILFGAAALVLLLIDFQLGLKFGVVLVLIMLLKLLCL